MPALGADRAELQLQREVVGAARQALAAGATRRAALGDAEEWAQLRKRNLEVVRSAFPPVMFHRDWPLNVRNVSSRELDEYRIENVLFESLPGWEVNCTLYLPKQPGAYPAVVCPTGHSTKTGRDYQRSAQTFARNGYIAASFDPPDCAGELSQLNDHFTNGLIGYLTGFWSQTHFVVDALRTLDYLQTRDDVDTAAGFGATGVSGGGLTSLFAAMLDERVAFCAPVCCLSTHESLHLTGLYTSCPEQFGWGYIAAGLDYVDYVASLCPRPCLIVAGKQDEVFDYRATTELWREARRLYELEGKADDCGLFIDEESGHGYTVKMANEVVAWMNRVIKHTDAAPLPLTDAEVPSVEPELLLCHPRTDVNMFTINRDEAARLKAARTFPTERAAPPVIPSEARNLVALRSDASRLLNVAPDVARDRGVGPHRVDLRSEPRRSWHCLVEELDVQPVPDVHLPCIMLSHVEDASPHPALLWIDEQGQWAALKQGGFLSGALGMYSPDCPPNQPRILSMDVSGLGRLEPEPTAYDLAGWNDIERILTYLSIATARPIMGLRVRDALCGLAYLRSRPDVDPQRMVVGGRGIGALVALHTALLAGNPSPYPLPGGEGRVRGRVQRVICLEMLSHYGAMTEQYPFSWRQSIIIPGILRHYDLPEAAEALSEAQVTIINPLDAQRNAIAQERAEELYAEAIAAGAVVRCGVDGGAAVVHALLSEW